MNSQAAVKVTELLKAWSDGDSEAADQLIALVYDELRRQAARYLSRERGNHTLRPTALVNEAYLQPTPMVKRLIPALRAARIDPMRTLRQE